MKKLEDYREEIEQCVKCGACRAHCPVFGAEKHEGRVARGKVALAGALLDGEIGLEEKLLFDMSQCLLCGSCCAQCPNKVPTEEIVAAARRDIAEKKGLSLFGKGLTTVLKNQPLMNVLAKSGGTLSSLLFKKLPEESGLHLRFPAPFISSDRTLPPIAAKPFRERVRCRLAAALRDISVGLYIEPSRWRRIKYPQKGYSRVRHHASPSRIASLR